MIAVCNCGNVIEKKNPKDTVCRCGNHIPREMFRSKKDTPYVIVTGFRGEKIKCYQQ
jgi:hypothetical protein